MSAAPSCTVALVARATTSARLPVWSPWWCVRTRSVTASQVDPALWRAAPMASALPATPVSTTAACRPRTRTYAETKPRLARDQVNCAEVAVPPVVAGSAVGASDGVKVFGGVEGLELEQPPSTAT